MKSNTFNYSLLAVGVAAVMGVSTGANAGVDSGNTSSGAAAINNQAKATYFVGTDKQPEVQSNTVSVSVTETAKFTLVAINGTSATDDKNEGIATTPKGSATFNHILKNDGNVRDTYTITTTSDDDDTITTATRSYALASAQISYTIDVTNLTSEQRTSLIASNSGMAINGNSAIGTINSGATITLLPKLTAVLSYSLTTPEVPGGSIGVGTLTATSAFITTATSTGTKVPKLVNENQTIVKLPVFAITKTAACEGSKDCTNLNLNGTNTDITYSIKVENVTTDYSANATNVVFKDQLPAGMTLVPGSVKFGGTAIADSALTITTTANVQTLQGTLPSLAVGANIIVEFRVATDKAILSTAGSATNDVTLYNNYDGTIPNPNGAFDFGDSTNESSPDNRPKVPADGPNTVGKDTNSTITFIDRNLTIVQDDAKEIGVKGDTVTYTQTITNNGNAAEGGTNRPINIKITDPAGDVLKTTAPYYVTANGDKIPLTAGVNAGEYVIPPAVVLAKDQSVVIGYTVVSDGKSEGSIGSANNDIGKFETNIVTLTPGGTTPPAVSSITNTTTIQGIRLVKLAAVVEANGNQNLSCPFGTAADSLTFSDGVTTAINAKPFDCIVYRIQATNTFKTKELSTIVLTDEKAQWDSRATYQTDVRGLSNGTSTGVTSNDTGNSITTTLATLPAEKIGTMTFSIKVKP